MWYMMNDFGGWGWLFGGVWTIVFWGGLIALIVWSITKLTGHDSTRHTPFETVKERYARGEITKEQFEQIKRNLY